jgi:hypothetical protein
MQLFGQTLLVAALFTVPAWSLQAQTPAADPSGHWQGMLQAPGMDLEFEVDLAKDGRGELAGSVSIPAQKLKGLPLLKVTVDGGTVTFYARSDQPLRGVLSADGTSMSGDFLAGGNTVPFTMKRIGDGRVALAATSAPIGKELEGAWNGTLETSGMQLRLILTLVNQPDGTAIGHIVNLDQGGLRLPLLVTQKGSSVTLDSTVVPSSFAGTLNPAATELAGTFSQGTLSVPVTFHRAAATDGKR